MEIPKPRTPEFKKYEGPPTWWTVLEQGFFQMTATEEGKRLYGDPEKGATVEQAWRTFGLYGQRPVCLVATDKPSVTTDAIEKVVRMGSKELVKTLSELLSISPHAAIQIFHHDGYTGHSVTLLDYNSKSSRFEYHEVWPRTSLLSKEYNAAGVEAVNVEGSRWSVTAAELEKVIMVAFVFQPLWAKYKGQKYCLTFDEIKSSDFWSFFHIREKERHLEKEDTTFVALETGGFKSEIELAMRLDQEERLEEAILLIKRSWLLGRPYGINPFALDIVRSYIIALILPYEQKEISDLTVMFTRIGNPDYARQLMKETDSSLVKQAAQTYLGAPRPCHWPMDFSTIEIKNLVDGNIAWLRITITHFLV